jgi:hypothetical protein
VHVEDVVPPAPDSVSVCLSCRFSYGTAAKVMDPPVSLPHWAAAVCCSLVHGSPDQRDRTSFWPLNLPYGPSGLLGAAFGWLVPPPVLEEELEQPARAAKMPSPAAPARNCLLSGVKVMAFPP